VVYLWGKSSLLSVLQSVGWQVPRLLLRVRKYLEFAVLTLVAAAILWWFGRRLNWSEVGRAVRQANLLLLLAAIAVISAVYLVRACRWGTFLAPLVSAQLRDLFAATTVGFGAVFLIGRAGEIVRPLMLPLRDRRVRPGAALVTIMVERIYDIVAVVVIFAANLMWLSPPADSINEVARVRVVGIIMLAGSVAAIVGLTWFRRRSKTAISWLHARLDTRRFVPARLSRIVTGVLEQLAIALRVLVDARELAITIGWTALVWFGIALANLLVIRAFGIPFGLSESIFVLGWSMIGSAVPTPGGAAGAFHAATAAGLLSLGVSRDTAAAVSIVLHLVDFGPAAIFGIFYFLAGDINLRSVRALASAEAVEHAVEDEKLVAGELAIEEDLSVVGTPD
jgi:glycosyltransferase 2 family protein